MKFRLTGRAVGDLNEICNYVRMRNPSAALRIRDAIEAALTIIATYPLAGRAKPDGVRRFTLPRYPYLIFYGVDEEAREIRVYSIRHAARREEDASDLAVDPNRGRVREKWRQG